MKYLAVWMLAAACCILAFLVTALAMEMETKTSAPGTASVQNKIPPSDEDGGSASPVPAINRDIFEKLGDAPYVSTDARGAISLDAQILFDFDSAELSDSGMVTLQAFLECYVAAVFADDGSTGVRRITVEGHTDTDGTHAYNLALSEERANVVTAYCVALYPELEDYLTAKGCAEECPVMNADGSVDMEASRRVCFVAE